MARRMRPRVRRWPALAVLLTGAALGLARSARAAEGTDGAPVNDRQISVMMFIDYGRGFGYQSLLAQIQIDTIKAQLVRDRQLLRQKDDLLRKKAIPPLERDVAWLKVIWNEKQLVVAEKSLATVAAQLDAMREMARHFGGETVSAESLYAIFRRAWDAGCDKGPDEVEAMQAWADFAAATLDRARQLQRQGHESAASVWEKEAQVTIARSNYEQRKARLDQCRKTLFPSLEDILAVGRPDNLNAR